jgi:prevent-host-death family protein
MLSTIAAGEFKAKCLKLLDEVAETRETLVITKHGKPVAQVIPMAEPKQTLEEYLEKMKGTGVILGDIISPIDVEWNAMKDDAWDEFK